MAKLQTLKRTARGLYSQFNRVTQIPEGGLLRADDCVCDREGVVGNRRGFKRYASLAGTARSFMEFKDRLVALVGSSLYYDSDSAGTMAAWTGTFSPPDSQTRMRGVEVRRDLYFTSSRGIWRNDALTNAPQRAGIPQALDLELALEGTGASWFTPGKQVAYHVTWARYDANNRLLRGEPAPVKEAVTNPERAVTLTASGTTVTATVTAHGYATGDTVEIASPSSALYEAGSHVITVTGADTYTYTVASAPPATGTAQAGKKFSVQVTFSIAADIIAGDTWELWRSELSADAATDPGERLFQIARKVVTSAQLAERKVTYLDSMDPVFLGEEIYTSPFREGVAQGNSRPPWAKDLAHFKGHVFYANTRREHSLELQLLDQTGSEGGLGMAAFVDGVISFTSDWFRWTTPTALGSLTIRSGSTTLTYNYGTAENVLTRTFKVHTSELTLAQNLRKTVQSLVRVVNRDLANDLVHAWYNSGTEDPPGKLLLRARSLDTAEFTVTASSQAVGERWSPELPLSGSAVVSQNEEKLNGLARAKFEEPDAVPRANESPVGSEESEILRIINIRDSLLIFKSQDGVYRLSGDDEDSFTLRQLDPSLKLLAPETAVVLDGSAYALTNQGVVKVNESGTAIVSRPVEEDLHRIFGISSYATLSHAVAHETERKYLLWTPAESGDALAPVAWCYNHINQTWTKWRKKVAAAIVLQADDMLYVAHAEDSFVLKERRYGSGGEDYSDEDIAVSVTDNVMVSDSEGQPVSMVTVDYTYQGKALAEGFLFRQGGHEARVTKVTKLTETSYEILLDLYLAEIFLAPATVSIPIVSEIEWAPDAVGNAGLMKQYTYAQLYFQEDSARYHEVGFRSDVVNAQAFANRIVLARLYGWGVEAWGSSPWGGTTNRASTPLRVPVHQQHQRARTLSVLYRHRYAKERFEILQMTLTARPYGERTSLER